MKTQDKNEPTIISSMGIKDDNDVARIKNELGSLMKHPGWQRISDYYKALMDYHQYQLNNDEGITTISDLKVVRFKRDTAEQLVNLPEILIGLISIEMESPVLDPHFTADDFNDKLN